MTIARYDQGIIQACSTFTEEGFLKCDAVVTRTGVFLYRNPDGTERRELRHPDDVLIVDSLQSMKMIPVTNDHPPERLVTAENAKRLSVGYTGENIRPDSGLIYSNFVVTDKETIDQIVNNGKKQLSLGYTVDLIEEKGEYQGEPYDYRQKNIKYNHLSIVQSARAGNQATIALDSQDAIEISQDKGETVVKKKVKIDEAEYMMEPEMAESVESLIDGLKNLKEEKTRVEEELKMMEDKLEKALAERDTAKEEAQALLEQKSEMETENNDAKEINRKVKERLSLLKIAEKVLDAEEMEKLDSASDISIKKKIIIAKSKNANLDGKSEVYINARFDAIVEDMPKNQVVIGAKKESVKSDSARVDAEEARAKMIENLKNAYKHGGK